MIGETPAERSAGVFVGAPPRHPSSLSAIDTLECAKLDTVRFSL
jgi:hypothetical protein